ncbi:MAG: DNA repair exonuclease [Planctomycetia bacterium]|nr:DNA repair exonuclease [Planctomycetia bacterium]
MKFIHTADLHIDSPMKGLSKLSKELAEKVKRATRQAFANLVEFALNERVDFILIAGDLFDGDWDQVASGKWILDQLKRLNDAEIPVFIVYGNHDKKCSLLKNWTNVLPERVKVLAQDQPQTFYYSPHFPGQILDYKRMQEARGQGHDVAAISGRSYPLWDCRDDLVLDYPAPTPNAFNIGILHTGLGGAAAQAYAPTDVDELNAKGYHYWALGHQHLRETIQTQPSWIGYSGSVQARHVNEREPKGFYLVECNSHGMIAEPNFIPCDCVRWELVSLDLTGLTEDDLTARTHEICARLLDKNQGRFVVLRLELTGRTPMYHTLCQQREKLADYFDTMIPDMVDDLAFEQIKIDQLKPETSEHFWESGIFKSIDALIQDKINGYAEMCAARQSGLLEPSAKVLSAEDEKICKDLKNAVNKTEKPPKSFDAVVDFSDPEMFLRLWERARETLADVFTQD